MGEKGTHQGRDENKRGKLVKVFGGGRRHKKKERKKILDGNFKEIEPPKTNTN